MILHITFSDGSNPYIFYPRAGFEAEDYSQEARGRAIVREFKRWKRAGFFPRAAFSVIVRGLTIEHNEAGMWYIRGHEAKAYNHLGHAIHGAIKLLEKGNLQ